MRERMSRLTDMVWELSGFAIAIVVFLYLYLDQA